MGAFNRILEAIGFPNEADEVEIERDNDRDSDRETMIAEPVKRRNNLVGIPGGGSASTMQVVISEPATIKEARELADQLKSRKQIIINLENTPRDISQRIIDFISGTVHAIEGQSQQVGKYIFVFTPKNMEINKEERGEMRRGSGSSSLYSVPSSQDEDER